MSEIRSWLRSVFEVIRYFIVEDLRSEFKVQVRNCGQKLDQGRVLHCMSIIVYNFRQSLCHLL